MAAMLRDIKRRTDASKLVVVTGLVRMVPPERSVGASTTSRPQSAPSLSRSDFASLFTQSFPTLYLVGLGITRDAAIAEDVVQEAAIIALEKLDQFQVGTNFSAWMSQLVRYVAFNVQRKERLRRAGPLDTNEMDRRTPSDGTTVDWVSLALGKGAQIPADQPDFDDSIVAALNKVSDVARSCLLLRTLGDLAYSEIAAIMAIPEGTAMSHVHRTRQLLRESAQEYDRSGNRSRGMNA